jgi:hypothetical protein
MLGSLTSIYSWKRLSALIADLKNRLMKKEYDLDEWFQNHQKCSEKIKIYLCFIRMQNLLLSN